ncbi:hypothetical protein FKM82_017191 [Ascaphus truei]
MTSPCLLNISGLCRSSQTPLALERSRTSVTLSIQIVCGLHFLHLYLYPAPSGNFLLCHIAKCTGFIFCVGAVQFVSGA